MESLLLLIVLYLIYCISQTFEKASTTYREKPINLARFTIGIIAGILLILPLATYELYSHGYAISETAEFYLPYSLQLFLVAMVIYSVFSHLFRLLNNRALIALISSVLALQLIQAGLFEVLYGLAILDSYYVEFFFEQIFNFEKYATPSVLVQLLVFSFAGLVFLHIALGFPKQSASSNASHFHIGENSVSSKSSSNEPLRIIAGLAACGRLPGQSTLEEEIEHPAQANPFPLDIDRDKILKLVKTRKESNFARHLLYSIISILALIIVSNSGSFTAILIALFLASIIYFITLQDDKYKIAAKYSPSNFDEAELLSIAEQEQNLVVYAGNSPFQNFGSEVGSWLLSVDKKRPKNGDSLTGQTLQIIAPDIEKLKNRLRRCMDGSGLNADSIKTMYFVQGRNIPVEIKPTGAVRPKLSVSKESIARLLALPDTPVREYLWIRKPIWSNDLSMSYFLRLYEDCDDLNLEISAIFIPPIEDSHRWVDKISPRGFRQGVADYLIS